MVQSIFARFKFMTIGRLTLALPEPTRPWRHLLSEFYDYPSAEIHTRRFNPFFTSSIFRLFDSPRLTHIHPRHLYASRVSWGVPRFRHTCLVVSLKASHTDFLLGPPFISESNESGNSRWRQQWCVFGVSLGHIPQTRVAFGGTAMSRGLCCVLVGNDLCMARWLKLGPLSIPNSCGHDTGGFRSQE